MVFKLLVCFIVLCGSLRAQNPHFSPQDLDASTLTDLEGKFTVQEIERFVPSKEDDVVFLRNGYARSEIVNAKDWASKVGKMQAVEINLIYSKYPKNKDVWRTDYRKLMIARLKALFSIDSSLNAQQVEWNILLQTDCNNEPEAMQLLHGIEIVFEPIPLASMEDTATAVDSTAGLLPAGTPVANKAQEKTIERFLKQNDKDKEDSTIQAVFNRHKDWKNMLVVMDWTGSMFGFGAKAMLWHVKNAQTSGIRNVVLFTDGEPNKKPGTMGNFGGVFQISAADPKKVMKLMKKSMFYYANLEMEENNIEALLKGIKAFPEFDEVVLIADNRSCIKDYCLCELVKVPVRVVLCGTEGGINPQYVNLAYRTGGSLHTMDSDLHDLGAYSVGGKILVIDGQEFVLDPKNDQFVTVKKLSRKELGYQECSRFYKKKKACTSFIAKYNAP